MKNKILIGIIAIAFLISLLNIACANPPTITNSNFKYPSEVPSNLLITGLSCDVVENTDWNLAQYSTEIDWSDDNGATWNSLQKVPIRLMNKNIDLQVKCLVYKRDREIYWVLAKTLPEDAQGNFVPGIIHVKLNANIGNYPFTISFTKPEETQQKPNELIQVQCKFSAPITDERPAFDISSQYFPDQLRLYMRTKTANGNYNDWKQIAAVLNGWDENYNAVNAYGGVGHVADGVRYITLTKDVPAQDSGTMVQLWCGAVGNSNDPNMFIGEIYKTLTVGTVTVPKETAQKEPYIDDGKNINCLVSPPDGYHCYQFPEKITLTTWPKYSSTFNCAFEQDPANPKFCNGDDSVQCCTLATAPTPEAAKPKAGTGSRARRASNEPEAPSEPKGNTGTTGTPSGTTPTNDQNKAKLFKDKFGFK